jgi:hypothetical protein
VHTPSAAKNQCERSLKTILRFDENDRDIDFFVERKTDSDAVIYSDANAEIGSKENEELVQSETGRHVLAEEQVFQTVRN